MSWLRVPIAIATTVIAFIRQLYLDGIKDPKRLTFKGLQALARA